LESVAVGGCVLGDPVTIGDITTGTKDDGLASIEVNGASVAALQVGEAAFHRDS
jgi:hypothetical protein